MSKDSPGLLGKFRFWRLRAELNLQAAAWQNCLCCPRSEKAWQEQSHSFERKGVGETGGLWSLLALGETHFVPAPLTATVN